MPMVKWWQHFFQPMASISLVQNKIWKHGFEASFLALSFQLWHGYEPCWLELELSFDTSGAVVLGASQ